MTNMAWPTESAPLSNLCLRLKSCKLIIILKALIISTMKSIVISRKLVARRLANHVKRSVMCLPQTPGFSAFPHCHDLQWRSIGSARAQEKPRYSYALPISPAGVTTMLVRHRHPYRQRRTQRPCQRCSMEQDAWRQIGKRANCQRSSAVEWL